MPINPPPPLCKPFLSHYVKYDLEVDMTIWWVWVPTPLWKILATPLITDDVKWSIRAKNVAYEAQPSVSLIFLAHSEVFCDLLLNRPTAWWRNKLLSTLTSSIRLSYYRPYETFFLEIERVTGLFIERNKPYILHWSWKNQPLLSLWMMLYFTSYISVICGRNSLA